VRGGREVFAPSRNSRTVKLVFSSTIECGPDFFRSLMTLDNLCAIVRLWSADQYLAHADSFGHR
jgi:hypothetical protein